MKTVSVSLNKNTLHAKPIRNILGINNLPLVNSARFYSTDKARFDALNFRYVRFHDSALENPGMQLVDISKIFPLFHLDETREENYFFKQTDLYMKSLADSDAEEDCIIKVCADGADKAILKSVNKAYDEKQCTDGVEILSENGTFDITHIGRDAVYFLEF